MNEIRIRTTRTGSCDECGRARGGVVFEVGADRRPGESFLCWEHFRLLLEAMKPGRTVFEERVTVRARSCRCRHACCRPRGETVGGSETCDSSAGPGACVSTERVTTHSYGTYRRLSSAG